ncbi:MM0924 family protein [uncultured Methanolobus sp.]|uniref:MM0924 family protein n=1 Tax=uncultured Methanolobus sp. TaxID=218300 RepID=UPI0029C6F4E9|nr:MM0924 family protein [uncultured Methanolobus sp.]
MKQSFIEKYYMGKNVSLNADGTTYNGMVAECDDDVLSLKWDAGDEYTHIEIAKISAIWKRV